MIEGIQGYQGMRPLVGAAGQQKVKEEFLAIFYKQLLKQAFKPPKLGFENEDHSLTGTFGSDLLVERLALELARSGAFSTDALFPSGLGK
jgi:hypothetical protein